MSGAGLMDFLIVIVGLFIIGGIIFAALEMTQIAPDAQFKQIAKYAVGGVLVLAFLWAVRSVFFGGGGGSAISPLAILDLAIAVIVLIVVLFIIDWFMTRFAPSFATPPIRYIIGGIALIVLLLITGKALFGGGLGFIESTQNGLGLHRPGPIISR